MFLAYLYSGDFVAPTDAYILAGLVVAIPPTAYLYVEQKRERKADNEFPRLLRALVTIIFFALLKIIPPMTAPL